MTETQKAASKRNWEISNLRGTMGRLLRMPQPEAREAAKALDALIVAMGGLSAATQAKILHDYRMTEDQDTLTYPQTWPTFRKHWLRQQEQRT